MLAAIALLQVIDLPPLDFNKGDWWVFFLAWLIERYFRARSNGGVSARYLNNSPKVRSSGTGE